MIILIFHSRQKKRYLRENKTNKKLWEELEKLRRSKAKEIVKEMKIHKSGRKYLILWKIILKCFLTSYKIKRRKIDYSQTHTRIVRFSLTEDISIHFKSHIQKRVHELTPYHELLLMITEICLSLRNLNKAKQFLIK